MIAGASVLTVLLTAGWWLTHANASHRVESVSGAQAAPSAPPFASAFVRSGKTWMPPEAKSLRHAATGVFGSDAFPASSGIVIESARSGAVLYSSNATVALAPASVLKLVVEGTALHDLGPKYRFTTRLVSDQAPLGDVLPGSLWLVGSGDPELTSADLERAVAAMKASGIRRIGGDVVADGSLFGPDAINPNWAADDLEYGYAALTSAVTMDGGTAQFTITPDPDGGAANVRVDPEAIGGSLLGTVRTVSSYAENTLRIDPLPNGEGFHISGQIPNGAPQKYWRSLSHPTQSAATALRVMLIRAGIAVDGRVSVGVAPAGAVALWSRQSRPLTDIIRRMTFDSDNHIAEQLLRAVGAQRFGLGTLENGLAAESAYLDEIGAGRSGIVLADASGLSTADRVSARTLAAVLRELASRPDAAAIAALLPRVGVEGTVHVRNLTPDARGRVLGKDGYIEGVSSLAGYVRTARHGVVIFAFIVDDWQRGLDAVWAGEDALLSRISQY